MPKLELDVIIRTHTGSNVHGGTRVVPFGKDVLILGCFRSLLVSLREARDRADIRITVVDDHSIPSVVNDLKNEGERSGFPFRFVSLSEGETGFYPSAHTAYEEARLYARNLVYFVEDDYLHAPEAVSEMLEAYPLFRENLGGREISFFPLDYPDNYDPRWISECRIVVGPHRHWRTNNYTTGTLMLTKRLFMAHWDKFSAFALYGLAPEIHEGTTIDRIWLEGHAVLFTPMPTLAIHMQFKENIPPFINWQDWWKKYALI